MESSETQIVPQCECGDPLDTLIVEAPATVTIIAMVQAELVPSDLEAGNVGRDAWDRRYLKSFRFEDQIEVLDSRIDHSDLEIDYTNNHGDSAIFAYCPDCNSELTREVFDAWCERATGDTNK